MLEGVRKGDVALAVVLTAMGVLLMVENIVSTDPITRFDSHSWWLVPVFAAATLPILWRRRGILSVTLVTAAALAVHVLVFGDLVRCGAGLPLAFALSYSVGRLASRGWPTWAGLVATLGVQALVLVRDIAAGWDALPYSAAIGVVAWGIGAWLRSRSDVGAVADSEPRSAVRV